MAKKKIEILGLQIRLEPIQDDDYICLTDIAKKGNNKEHKFVIHNWMKNSSTVEFLYEWETLHNPDLKKGVHLHTILGQNVQRQFVMTPKKWISLTDAIGIRVKLGRGGAVYAHKDIALNFCYWVSPKFQVYLIKEFQRLMEEEYDRKNIEWHLSKITDNIDEVRNLLDTFPHQDKSRNRINRLDKPKE